MNRDPHQTSIRKVDPAAARRFAVEVVSRLREAGFQAVWAGGCVRDRLLGIEPKDYDVATNATPEQIRELFSRRRTLAIGQSFGVIAVLGPRAAGQIDVATFRRDSVYSDGRHPDAVTFSTAEEDAQRRDFTINGLFFDPLEDRVLDYVGGQADLQQRVIRAIGDPHARLAEDKLRMLRAVRFAAVFDFSLDAATLEAIRQHAREIALVSAERIAAELRRMLVNPRRRRAAELLHATALRDVILPGFEQAAWNNTLEILDRLRAPSFPVALAALIRPCVLPPADATPGCAPPPATDSSAGDVRGEVARICQRLKLTVAERKCMEWVLTQESVVRSARRQPWPRLQRVLIHEGAADLLCYGRAVAAVLDGDEGNVDYCQQRLTLPPEELNPPALINGEALKAAGLPPGPAFAQILEAVRDAQLEKQIASPAAALALARQLHAQRKPPTD
jgi:tRNA nucleotidyltransferase/poly(A) polymerase